jgi:hypothetical protein
VHYAWENLMDMFVWLSIHVSSTRSRQIKRKKHNYTYVGQIFFYFFPNEKEQPYVRRWDSNPQHSAPRRVLYQLSYRATQEVGVQVMRHKTKENLKTLCYTLSQHVGNLDLWKCGFVWTNHLQVMANLGLLYFNPTLCSNYRAASLVVTFPQCLHERPD